MTDRTNNNSDLSQHNIKNKITEKAGEAKRTLQDSSQDLADQACETISNSLSSMKEQSTAMRDNMVDYTTQKPFKALGIALITGVTLGYLMRRK